MTEALRCKISDLISVENCWQGGLTNCTAQYSSDGSMIMPLSSRTMGLLRKLVFGTASAILKRFFDRGLRWSPGLVTYVSINMVWRTSSHKCSRSVSLGWIKTLWERTKARVWYSICSASDVYFHPASYLSLNLARQTPELDESMHFAAPREVRANESNSASESMWMAMRSMS
jgi:hypothetical protein